MSGNQDDTGHAESSHTAEPIKADQAEASGSATEIATRTPFSLYEYCQTEKGRRNSWYIGVLVGTIATLSAGYAFWPQPAPHIPIPACSEFEQQSQRLDCLLEKGTISFAERIQLAETMRIEVAPETKGISLANLDPSSPERRFEQTVRDIAADSQQSRREALVLARHPDTRASGLDKLAGLAKTVQDWRQVGELAYPWDTARAIAAYEQVIKADSKQTWDYIYLARLHVRGGDLNSAKTVLTSTQSLTLSDRDQSVVFDELGNISVSQGDLPAARTAFQDSLDIRERLAQADPSNTEFQRDIMVSYWKLASLGGDAEASHWIAAYQALKALDDAGKMQPIDQESLDVLEAKMKELRD